MWINDSDVGGATPLHLAAILGLKDVALILLEKVQIYIHKEYTLRINHRSATCVHIYDLDRSMYTTVYGYDYIVYMHAWLWYCNKYVLHI